ncbi:hypothetical protein ABT144_24605 [Streptomyces sp. NPDC002039]|uniref:hypothetical protein n=1 Tax=Streptomyces sp. NPDC002039 TaxID=3154660 RepID=UPI00331CD91A
MTITYWILAGPLAAVGFVLLQIGAITVHLTGGDGQVALNVVRVITAAATIRPAMSWL